MPSLCQIEILVLDLAKSTDFYCRVLGLELVPIDIHDLAVFRVSNRSQWGFCLRRCATLKQSTSVILYFAVESLNHSHQVVESQNGGAVLEEKEIVGYGRVLYISDPDGHVFALFEAKIAPKPVGQPETGY